MKRNKKGFSLIEMLVVIAIIAILVSIVTPIAGNSSVKAAAAANAANLRTIEGQLSVMKVTDPDALKSNIIMDGFTGISTFIQTIREVASATPNYKVQIALLSAIDTIGDRIAENIYYARNEQLQLNGKTIDAPNAKPLSVKGITITKTTQMQVAVTENAIVATYGGMTADAFAAIAEGGDAGDYTNTPHKFIDGNRDTICDFCKKAHGNGGDNLWEDIANSYIDGIIAGNHACTDANQDCVCDEPGCGLSMHIDETGRNTLFGSQPDGICDRNHGGTQTPACHAFVEPSFSLGTPKCVICNKTASDKVHTFQ